ncbi:MAG: hypothetical protein ACYTFK_14490 [Planctomycetota bacterium]
MTPEKAWANGTNVLAAFRIRPARTEATLILLLKDTLQYLDYNKSIKADRDILDAVHHLRDTFPAMKVEEWAIIMHRLKTGEYRPGYERLKLPELCDIFQQYEGERAAVREGNWNELKKHAPDRLSNDQLDQLYANYKKRRAEENKELKKAEDIKRVPVKDGRWEHIPYPNDPLSDSEET